MRPYKLTLTYDGTGFVGWQRQASGTSIQGLLEEALATLDGQPVTVSGAGRTDAGVHALGQVASFSLTRAIDPETLVRALNFHLPASVRAVSATAVDGDFHARFSAVSKSYRYQIWTAGPLPPLFRACAWHVPGPLDVAAMAAAARLVEGRHDFAAFQSTGTEVPDTEREIFDSRVKHTMPDDDGWLRGLDAAGGVLVSYDVTGSGFLRHMVRAIAGTLVEIGLGRRPVHAMSTILASRDRAQAGRTAPAEGLVLVRVTY